MASPRPTIPGVPVETEVALYAIIDKLQARLAALEAQPTAPPLIQNDYTAQVGQYLRIAAPPGGLTLLLPQPQSSNRGASVTLAFEGVNPVTIEALEGTVNGLPFVRNTLIGTFQATSNGEDNWAVALGMGTNGLAVSTGPKGARGAPGDAGDPGARGRAGDDGLRGFPGQPGAMGATGVMGFWGQDGQDGQDGLPGATGAQGLQGFPGFAGQDGQDGNDGFGLPGPTGPGNGVPALFPPTTFFGNDTASTVVGSPQSLPTLAGNGLRFTVERSNAPVPTVLTLTAGEADQSRSAASINVALPGSRAAGDRLILFVAAVNGTVSAPAGWTDLTGIFGTNDHHVFERVLDGTESNVVTVSSTLSGDLLVHQIAVRGSDPALASISAGNTGASPTQIDAPAVTATWGAVNNLFIGASLWLFNPTIVGFPPELTGTGQVTFGSQTIGYGFFSSANTATLDPGLWTANVSARPTAFTLVVPPLPVGAFSVSPAVVLALGGQDGQDGQDGIPGAPGVAGAIGPAGPQGTSLVFFGADGQDGEPGVMGSPGAQGATGDPGPQGTSLIFFGADGADGDQGMIGPQGAPGIDGVQGPQGASLVFFGADGADGDQGLQGFVGATGATGDPGPAGQALTFFGADGQDGDQGMIGPQGAQGVPGVQGPQGTSLVFFGADGQDGDPGALFALNPGNASLAVQADSVAIGNASTLNFISGTGNIVTASLVGSLVNVQLDEAPAPSFVTFEEEFVTFAVTSVPTVGAFQTTASHTWLVQGGSNAGSLSITADQQNHPGILRLTTGTTSGDAAYIAHSQTLSTGQLSGTRCRYFCWIIALPSITGYGLQCGLSSDWTNTSTPSDCIMFTIGPSLGVQFNQRSGGSGGTGFLASTFLPVANTFMRLEATRSGTTWTYTLDGGLQVSSGGAPSALMSFGLALKTNTASTAKSVDMDLCAYNGSFVR